MSVILPKSGPLPAAVVAAAFAAATQPAEAAAWNAAGGPIQNAFELGGSQSAELLRWVRGATPDWRGAVAHDGNVERLLDAHHDHAATGFDILKQWATARGAELTVFAETAWREAETTLRVARRLDGAETLLAAADAVATTMAAAGERAATLVAGREIKVFTLRAEATPAAPVKVRALIQPLYDIYGRVLTIEATLAPQPEWSRLTALLDRAERALTNRQNGAHLDRLESLNGAVRAVEAASTGAAGIMRVAKAEFLRIASEAARIALADVPVKEARLSGETPSPIAAVDGGAPRPFGRRIDYRTLADKWVGRR